jgi:hypothetical protein
MDPPCRIDVGANLTAELGRVIGVAVANRLTTVDAKIPTTSGIHSTPSVLAKLTLEDIQYIPDEIADHDNLIEAAARRVCEIVNVDAGWNTIVRLKERLIENQPKPIAAIAAIIAGIN